MHEADDLSPDPKMSSCRVQPAGSKSNHQTPPKTRHLPEELGSTWNRHGPLLKATMCHEPPQAQLRHGEGSATAQKTRQEYKPASTGAGHTWLQDVASAVSRVQHRSPTREITTSAGMPDVGLHSEVRYTGAAAAEKTPLNF